MTGTNGQIVRRVSASSETTAAVGRELIAGLGTADLECIIVFASRRFDLCQIGNALEQTHPKATVIGCTTAGEIGATGYADGTVVAIGLPRAQFRVATTHIPDIRDFAAHHLVTDILKIRADLAEAVPNWTEEFGVVLLDGLAISEDRLASALAPAIETLQTFGGSAGDGMNFEETLIYYQGRVHANAAVMTVMRTTCSVHVFRFDNFTPTTTQMVVTDADAENRLVKEINAAPAAQEYARLLGIDPTQLSRFMFASHPVVVRVGEDHYVRAINSVQDTGNLQFFSAIDEGMVLTLADGSDLSSHLDSALTGLSVHKRPDAIIAFDCVLRRLDAEKKKTVGHVSDVLRNHGVFGFSTYGEMHNATHVNQTCTGVAIYPPREDNG